MCLGLLRGTYITVTVYFTLKWVALDKIYISLKIISI